jgi:hypothetical protein
MLSARTRPRPSGHRRAHPLPGTDAGGRLPCSAITLKPRHTLRPCVSIRRRPGCATLARRCRARPSDGRLSPAAGDAGGGRHYRDSLFGADSCHGFWPGSQPTGVAASPAGYLRVCVATYIPGSGSETNTPQNIRVRPPRSCYSYCMISPIRGDRTGFRVQVSDIWAGWRDCDSSAGTAGAAAGGCHRVPPTIKRSAAAAAVRPGPAAPFRLTALVISGGHTHGPAGRAGAAASFRLRIAGPASPCRVSLAW